MAPDQIIEPDWNIDLSSRGEKAMTEAKPTYQDIEFPEQAAPAAEKPSRGRLRPRVQGSPLTNWWNERQRKNSLKKAWYKRNIENSEIFLHSIEMEDAVMTFQQTIFLQEDPALNQKLARQGFKPLSGFPDEKHYDAFSRIMYNEQFNIAISLYTPRYYKTIANAIKIANQSTEDSMMARVIFINAMKVLLED